MTLDEANLFPVAVRLMNSAAFAYLAASFAHIFAISSSKPARSASWSNWGLRVGILAFVLHTSGLIVRWVIGGIDRPPWTNLYESLVFFGWGVALFQILAQSRWKIKLAGVVGMPIVFILMGMSVMTPNKTVEPLMPALQSNWLKIHVVFGMLSYAGFTTAGCLAFLHLIRNRVSMSKIGAGLALLASLNLLIAGGGAVWKTGRFEMAKTTTITGPDGTEMKTKDTYREFEGGPVLTRTETVPFAQAPFFLSLAGFLAGAAMMIRRGRGSQGMDMTRASVSAFGAGVGGLALLFGAIGAGLRKSETLTLHSNPYLTLLLFMTFFLAVAFLLIVRRYEGFQNLLPSADRLDELSYMNVLFAFPFQTLLLITGAVWAYYAWGRSWGWDPKETWALITWLAFLIYLHGKLLMRWKPNLLSSVAIVGFVILVFAFLGVNLVLSGLHSYGSA